MKNILYSILIILTIILTFTANTPAQDSSQWHLPEGAKARLGNGRITGNVVYSPDGSKLAVASRIGVWIYDAQTDEELDLFTGHTASVRSVSFSPDGSTLASGSDDTTIRMWEADTGTHIRTISGHTSDVLSVSFSPDGSTLASASGDIRLWNADTGTHIRTLSGHTDWVNSVSFSPDGTTIASGSDDRTIRLWEADTGTHIRTLSGHTGWVFSVSFSPDGSTLASGSDDNTIRLWNATTGTHIRTLEGRHTASVRSVSFSPDGSTLASASGDEIIRIGSGGDTISLWNVDTGTHIRTLERHTPDVFSVSFSPDGSTLASASSDSTIRLWNAHNGNHIRTLSGHTDNITSVSFSPDGTTLATGSQDKTVRLWDVKTGAPLQTLTGHGWDFFRDQVIITDISVSFSPDGSMLASGSGDDTARLWDVATGELLLTFHGNMGDVGSVSFSPDGTILATGSGGYAGTRIVDSRIDFWDVKTGELLRTLTGHTWVVNSVSFSPDGSTLASGSSGGNGQDYTVRFWDVATGELLRTLEHAGVSSVSFSPDGSILVSGSWDKTIRLWEADTGTHIRTISGHTDSVSSVSFSPDGTTIASGSSDGTIRLWEADTGRHIRTISGHTDSVSSVSFSPDGTTIASGSYDGTVLLWDLTRTEQEKSVIVSFRLENGKEVTLYRENEDTLVYTIGFPDEAPELEYSGPILESVSGYHVLWDDGIESLAALSSELMTGEGHWSTLNGEPDIIAEAISKAANSDESHGFISVSVSTGLISQSAYIFRTSGWEYAVSYTEGRPFNVPEDDYKSYSLTALAPDGKMLRLHSATNATDSISHDTVPSPANSKQFTLSRLRYSVGVLGVRINEASVNIQDGIGVEGGVSYDFNRFAVIADYRLAMSLKGFEAETEAETELDFSPLWIFQSGSLGARVYLIQKGFSPYIGGGVSVIWMSRKLILIDEDKLGPGIYGVIGIDTGRFSKSGLKLELRIDKPFSTFENEVSVLDELIDIEWDQKTFTPVSLGIYYSKQF